MRIIHECWKCEIQLCGNKWIAKSTVPPTQCPRCHSRHWNDSGIDRTKEPENQAPQLPNTPTLPQRTAQTIANKLKSRGEAENVSNEDVEPESEKVRCVLDPEFM